MTIPVGWYTVGASSSYYNSVSTYYTTDCKGWSSTNQYDIGPVWSNGEPAGDGCDVMHVVLCCD